MSDLRDYRRLRLRVQFSQLKVWKQGSGKRLIFTGQEMTQILVVGTIIIGIFILSWFINLIISMIRLRRSDIKQRLIIVSVVTILSIIIITINLLSMLIPINKILDGAVFCLFGWSLGFVYYVLRWKEKQCWLLLLYAILFDLVIFLSLTLLIVLCVKVKITYIQNIMGIISIILGMVLSFILITKQKLPFTKM